MSCALVQLLKGSLQADMSSAGFYIANGAALDEVAQSYGSHTQLFGNLHNRQVGLEQLADFWNVGGVEFGIVATPSLHGAIFHTTRWFLIPAPRTTFEWDMRRLMPHLASKIRQVRIFKFGARSRA